MSHPRSFASELRLLAAAAFLGGAFQLLAVQEILVLSHYARPLVSLTLAGAGVLFGFGILAGARLEAKRGDAWDRRLLGGTAIAIACFLGTVLRADPSTRLDIGSLAGHLVVVGLYGAVFGRAQSSLMLRARPRLGWAAMTGSIALLGGGELAGIAAAPTLGVNAGLVIVAVSTALAAARLRRLLPIVAAAIAAAGYFSLDDRLESLRRIQLANMTQQEFSSFSGALMEHIHGSWSWMGRFDVYRRRGGEFVVGFVNYQRQWSYPPLAGLRLVRVREDDRVLVLGMGAGAGIEELGVPLTRRITGTDINASVLDFFGRHPELNDHAFQRITALPYDARALLEELPGPWDAIVAENMNNPFYGTPVSLIADYTVTEEAIELILARLAPGGGYYLLTSSGDKVGAVFGSLARRGISVQVFEKQDRKFTAEQSVDRRATPRRRWCLVASRDPDALRRFLPPDEIGGWFRIQDPATQLPPLRGKITDDRPYLVPLTARAFSLRDPAQACAGFLLLLSLMGMAAAATAVSARGMRAAPLSPLYFLLVGCGFSATHFLFLEAFRSILRQPLHTQLAVNGVFLSAAALGGACSPAFLTGARRRWALAAALSGGFVCSYLVTAHMPYGAGGLAWKCAALAAAIAPLSIAAGLCLPVGLMRVSAPDGVRALFLDSIGGCLGVVLSFATAWFLGLRLNWVWIAACYAGAAFLMSRSWTAGAPR